MSESGLRSLNAQLDTLRSISEAPTDCRTRRNLFNQGKRLARVLVACKYAEIELQRAASRHLDADFPDLRMTAHELAEKHISELRGELHALFAAEIEARLRS